jgi:hypothetical protein
LLARAAGQPARRYRVRVTTRWPSPSMERTRHFSPSRWRTSPISSSLVPARCRGGRSCATRARCAADERGRRASLCQGIGHSRLPACPSPLASVSHFGVRRRGAVPRRARPAR